MLNYIISSFIKLVRLKSNASIQKMIKVPKPIKYSPKIIKLLDNIEVEVQKSLRAKRIQIRVTRGQVILIVPKNIAIAQAREFLNFKTDWIKKQLNQHSERKTDRNFTEGALIRILGKEYKIVYSKTASISNININLTDNQLIIYGTENIELTIKNFLSSLLKEKIEVLASEMCKKLCVQYNKISVKDISSRWGSCSSKKNLSFSIKLIFTEIDILKYVIAHEVSHLKEMNHSKKFWSHVEELYPNWRQARRWLREQGRYIA